METVGGDVAGGRTSVFRLSRRRKVEPDMQRAGLAEEEPNSKQKNDDKAYRQRLAGNDMLVGADLLLKLGPELVFVLRRCWQGSSTMRSNVATTRRIP